MSQPAPPVGIAVIRTLDDLVAVWRRRRDELGITHATIDAVSGLADGYASKLLAPTPMKNPGNAAIEGMNGALAIKLIVVEDEEQAALVSGRWTKRARPSQSATLSIALSIENQVPAIIPITPEIQQQIERKDFMRTIGKIGGKRRLKTMKKRARQRAASHAARKRWGKENQ